MKSVLKILFSFKCVTLLTDITEQYREEDEAMWRPQQHYGQVHPKVEDLEDLRLGKGQDYDTSEFC